MKQPYLKRAFMLLVFIWPFVAVMLWPMFAPDIDLLNRNALPSLVHPFGTDLFGRDLFLRLSYGLGLSYIIAILVVVTAFFCSVFLTYTYVEMRLKFVRQGIDKVMNYLFILPTLLIALLLSTLLAHDFLSIYLSITLYSICFLFFSLKSHFLLLKKQPYIAFAKQSGFSNLRILFYHYLKPIQASVIERLKLVFLSSVAIETGLAFIGVHLSQEMPSLGNMLAQQYKLFYIFPYQLVCSIGFFVVNLWIFERLVHHVFKSDLFSHAKL